MNITTKKILSLSFLFLIMIIPMFVGAFNTDMSGDIAETGLSNKSISDIALAIMNWLLMIITILAVIGFIISGIYFITAGGSGRVEEAKAWLTYSVIGIIVALSGYVIIYLVQSLLMGDPTQTTITL